MSSHHDYKSTSLPQRRSATTSIFPPNYKGQRNEVDLTRERFAAKDVEELSFKYNSATSRQAPKPFIDDGLIRTAPLTSIPSTQLALFARPKPSESLDSSVIPVDKHRAMVQVIEEAFQRRESVNLKHIHGICFYVFIFAVTLLVAVVLFGPSWYNEARKGSFEREIKAEFRDIRNLPTFPETWREQCSIMKGLLKAERDGVKRGKTVEVQDKTDLDYQARLDRLEWTTLEVIRADITAFTIDQKVVYGLVEEGIGKTATALIEKKMKEYDISSERSNSFGVIFNLVQLLQAASEKYTFFAILAAATFVFVQYLKRPVLPGQDQGLSLTSIFDMSLTTLKIVVFVFALWLIYKINNLFFGQQSVVIPTPLYHL